MQYQIIEYEVELFTVKALDLKFEKHMHASKVCLIQRFIMHQIFIYRILKEFFLQFIL